MKAIQRWLNEQNGSSSGGNGGGSSGNGGTGGNGGNGSGNGNGGTNGSNGGNGNGEPSKSKPAQKPIAGFLVGGYRRTPAERRCHRMADIQKRDECLAKLRRTGKS